MNHRRVWGSRGPSLIASLALVVLAGRGETRADEARKVHALLAVDYQCKPGLPGQKSNQDNITFLLNEVKAGGGNAEGRVFPDQVDPGRVSIEEIGREGLTPAMIQAYFRGKADVGPNDTLLFYYSGHGATDPERGHLLATSGGSLLRSDLIASMTARQPRLAVVLTDCRSSTGYYTPPKAMPTGSAGDPAKVLRSLLFRARGLVDITAATYNPRTRTGEFGWFVGYDLPGQGRSPGGGIFTMSLSNVLMMTPFEALDANGDDAIGWAEVVRPLRTTMNENYQTMKRGSLARAPRDEADAETQGYMRNQATQRAAVFSVGTKGDGGGDVPPPDGNPNPPRRRFGVFLIEVAGRGVQVTSVTPGTPASRVTVQELTNGVPTSRVTSMAAGDLISFVNDVPTPTLQDFFRELNAVPAGGVPRIKGLDGAFQWQRGYTASVRLD